MKIGHEIAIRFRKCSFAILAAFASSAIPAQTIYYVAPSGKDTNSGTSGNPFREIRRALTLASPGDSILVSDGSYLGFDVKQKNGTSNAPIIIQALGSNANITATTDRNDNRDTIFITFSTWIVVDGLRAFNANRAGVRVDQSQNVTIRNGVFGNNAAWGIFTDFSDDLLLENNDCFGSVDQHGIYVSNSGDRPTVRGNRCHDNKGAGIQLNADRHVQPGDGIITGAMIENNVIYNNGVGGGGALNLDGVQDSVVRNNLLFNNHASGIICFKVDGADGPKGMQILHNTVDMAADARWALSLTDTTGSNYVRNNILFARGATRGGLRCVSSTDVSNTDSDDNLMNYITPNDGKMRYTLAQWQALGHDAHSVTGALTSVFINDSVGNYHLAANSAAVDGGLVLATVVRDLEGIARRFGGSSDIGCYEQSPLRVRMAPAMGGNLLQIHGDANPTYQLQFSTNLSDWTSLSSFVSSNRPLLYLDSKRAGFPSGFYRAKSP